MSSLRRRALALAILLALLGLSGAFQADYAGRALANRSHGHTTPTATPTRRPHRRPTATPTATPTRRPHRRPTATPTATLTATPTATPTAGQTELFGSVQFFPEYMIVSDTGCTPGESGMVQKTISAAEFIDTAGLSYPTVGQVMLSNDTSSFIVPIRADASGALSYHAVDLPPGNYMLQAYLFYHHPLDPPGVARLYSKLWSVGVAQDSVMITIGSQGPYEFPIILKLNGSVCPTP